MSETHLVLIPSFNPGPTLRRTVAEAAAEWESVWVVSDGSTDGSDAGLEVPVLRRAGNGGKGAAVLHGLRHAAAAGFTHALVMDADGQQPAWCIRGFMAESLARPEAMVLGQPGFGRDAPAVRRYWRRVANGLTRLAAPGAGIGDALFGFRVYPIAPLLAAFAAGRSMRGFDFDPEAAIRLAREGMPVVSLPAPVRYPGAGEGGVSHFRYGRDNLLLARMFARLLLRR